jgi:hypothetical protein
MLKWSVKHFAISTGGVVAYRVSYARCFLWREVDEVTRSYWRTNSCRIPSGCTCTCFYCSNCKWLEMLFLVGNCHFTKLNRGFVSFLTFVVLITIEELQTFKVRKVPKVFVCSCTSLWSLFTCLFIYGLFNDAGSASGYVASCGGELALSDVCL